jgi:hypothetical protein
MANIDYNPPGRIMKIECDGSYTSHSDGRDLGRISFICNPKLGLELRNTD